MQTSMISLGIDIGSTTAKLVIMRGDEVLWRKYERHYSLVRAKILEMLEECRDVISGESFSVAISGSAGLGLAEAAGIPFVQEVYSTYSLIKQYAPDTDVVIELGGEDAKIIFLSGGIDERMNGTCAGGTGAFIDQMATLLNVTSDELDELSLKHEKVYPIASRCGVFAKTDIQPLINQGVTKADIAASIFHAVVNQTIAGLAQGRKIMGNVMFLGGPLYYNRGLRRSFVETLGLSPDAARFPDYSLYAVALGASLYAKDVSSEGGAFTYDSLREAIKSSTRSVSSTMAMPPLFKNEGEYAAFNERHGKATVDMRDISDYSGEDVYLGIDCGSTTTKLALVGDDGSILWSYYSSNRGNPVEVVKARLDEIYDLIGDRLRIRSAAVTGYGEELIKNAFHLDFGIVETMAHFRAAEHFDPNVDFILDIGGQDIKCIRIKNRAVDSIMLNEACSSGCGSFIETFARSMGYDTPAFAKLGITADAPVDLGSRCTVFMNSSIKQAQKDGISINNISAGISASVVKNALYKVIRANSPDELGKNIVVQGGTFYNDAVLRAFELEIGREVTRPTIAGLMGAYGAALYARDRAAERSTIIGREELAAFNHKTTATVCKGCGNHCNLTINTFFDGSKYISGNRCEKMTGNAAKSENIFNMHEYKRRALEKLSDSGSGKRTVGLPLALGMLELLPLWYTIFTELGFHVVTSGESSKEMYLRGQASIPSDTACYPAKLMHGHIETLISRGVDAIFTPSLTYNFKEDGSYNHYNCPVVAYYPELLRHNIDELRDVKFIYPYLDVNNESALARGLFAELSRHFDDISQKRVKAAVKAGLGAYEAYKKDIADKTRAAIEDSRKQGRKMLVFAGRPYHIDREIGHGIDQLAVKLGFTVLTEDGVAALSHVPPVDVLNQWTYHSRLYAAAQFAADNDDVELVQLVSFGCGIDAITTDEVRAILERNGKIYTQIKIDEIANLSAVNIRLRSLLGALEMRAGGK